ncbi:unnamed protein product, partial [Mesorhabditis spiculigera]
MPFRSATFIVTIVFVFNKVAGQHFSVDPPHNAFYLFSPVPSNLTEQKLYLHDDCPSQSEQIVSATYGGKKSAARLQAALHNYNCAVSIRVVQDVIRLDRPFIDVVAQSDGAALSSLRRRLCVSVRVSSPSGATVTAHCELNPFEETRHSCLVRIQVPFSWFGQIGADATKQTLSLTHVTAPHCDAHFYERPQVPISLLPYLEAAQAHVLRKDDSLELSLLSRSNLSFSLNSLNSLFVHLSYNLSEEKDKDLDELELRVWLDSRFEVVNAASLSPGAWSVRPLSAPRPRTHTSFLCTRIDRNSTFDGYLFALLLKLRGSVISDARRKEVQEDVESATLHWEVRLSPLGGAQGNGNGTKVETQRVATPFRVAPDVIYAIVPITKSTSLINTAVLSATQYSIPMRIISVTIGGLTRDITALSHCISSEVKVIKTSPTCSSVYVDGSELRGSPAARVHIHYEQWTTQVTFAVWFPRVPVTIWLSNPTLHTVSNWPVAVWKQLETAGAARQFGCSERYQHSEIRILASFQVGDDKTGERHYLAGGRETLFDVTPIAAARVHSANRSIATIKNADGKLIVYAHEQGTSRIVLKSSIPQIDYGSSLLTVTNDAVSLKRISALPIVEVEPHIIPISGHRAQYFVLARIQTTFTHKYQHGAMAIHLTYSDDQTESLLDIPPSDYSLSVFSSEEHCLAVRHGKLPPVDLIALDDLTDAEVSIKLRPSEQCRDVEGDALAYFELPISLTFTVGSHRNSTGGLANTTVTPYENYGYRTAWRVDMVAAVVVITLLLVLVCRLFSRKTKSFDGYEKLVVPLLSRLSSSSSGGQDAEETKEWVWIGRPTERQFSYRHHIPSATSSHSDGMRSLPERNTRSSGSIDEQQPSNISYRGSEISVFISPQPSISVCNHLFSPPDAPLFTSSHHKRQSVLSQGWHWGKKAISPSERRHDNDSHTSRSYDGPTWRTQRELPYTQLPITVDNNQNYRNYEPENTTVIPNYYSIRDELQRENLRFNRQDFVNNNFVSPPGDRAKTPLSPKHMRHYTHSMSKSDTTSHTGALSHRAIEPKSQSCYRLSQASSDPITIKYPPNYKGPEPKPATSNGVAAIHQTAKQLPIESIQEVARPSARRTVVQASTSELLRALGIFVLERCPVPSFEPAHVVIWLRTVDRALLLQGWQDVAFINPANLVFVYLLVRDMLPSKEVVGTLEELHQWLLTSLYIGYSYMGNEISYPLKPFVIESDRSRFWDRTVEIIKAKSADMLRLNSSSSYFAEVFTEFKRYAEMS